MFVAPESDKLREKTRVRGWRPEQQRGADGFAGVGGEVRKLRIPSGARAKSFDAQPGLFRAQDAASHESTTSLH